jgi:hypothetical protein
MVIQMLKKTSYITLFCVFVIQIRRYINVSCICNKFSLALESVLTINVKEYRRRNCVTPRKIHTYCELNEDVPFGAFASVVLCVLW